MQNISEMIVEYADAFLELCQIVKTKANGHWDKLPLLIKNHKRAEELFETMVNLEDHFREAASLGKIFTYPEELEPLYKLINAMSSVEESKLDLQGYLEDIKYMIEDLFKEKDEWAKAIQEITQLPNYRPNDWIRRKYMVQGIYIPSETTAIPKHLIQRLEEACYSFIYGNFFSTVALARATVETALKTKYPELKNLTLHEITNDRWFKIKGLKEHNEMQKTAESIRKWGNEIMHDRKDKITNIYNELKTKAVLHSLRSFIEFIYQ